MSPKEKLENLIAVGEKILRDRKAQGDSLAKSLADKLVPQTVRDLVKESTSWVKDPHGSSIRYVVWQFNQRLSFTAVVDIQTQELNFCVCDILAQNGCHQDVTNYSEEQFAMLFAKFQDSLDL